MKFSVEQVGREPIILVTLISLADFETTLIHIFAQAAAIQTAVGQPCFRIDDLTKVDFSVKELSASMYHESQSTPGSATDPMIRHIIVSTARILHPRIVTLPQTRTPDNRTPVFATVTQALDYARAQGSTKHG